MAYLFQRKRKMNSSIETNTRNECPMEPDTTTDPEPTSSVPSSSNNSPESEDPLSPGNSPGGTPLPSIKPFKFRSFFSDIIFSDRNNGKTEEKYFALVDSEVAANVDVLDRMRDCTLVENPESHQKDNQTDNTNLNNKILLLEEELRNCRAENETLTIMMEDLIRAQESHQEQLKEIRKFYDQKIEEAKSTHEIMIQEIIDSNLKQVEDFISKHEGLIEDLINSHEQQIREWQLDFAADMEVMPELKNENAAISLPSKMWAQFQDLSVTSQGLVVVGITVLGTLVGISSWRFIFWAWPKLISFAASIEAADLVQFCGWLKMFMNSSGYEKFVQAWESEEPLTKKDIQEFGTDILSFGLTHFGSAILNRKKRIKPL